MKKINSKINALTTIKNSEYLSDDFIIDKYLESRKNIRIKINFNVLNSYDNCLFFIGLTESFEHYQINNITKTKQKINNINEYFNVCKNATCNVFNISNCELENYVDRCNNLHFTIILSNHIEINSNIFSYDIFALNFNKSDAYFIKYNNEIGFFNLMNNLSKIAVENSIIMYGIIDNNDLQYINNMYYSTNCFSLYCKKYGTYLRECVFNIDKKTIDNNNIYNLCDIINNKCTEMNNAWLIINNYLRCFDDTANIKSHKKFHKCIYYQSTSCNHYKFKDMDIIFARFATKLLPPSNKKLCLFDNCQKNNMFEIGLNEHYKNIDGDKEINPNVKLDLLIYNFCTLANMFENNYVFKNIITNITYVAGKYDWHIIIPYHNRLDNLTYLIQNIEQKITPNINVIITVVEIDYTNTLKETQFYNKINYVLIDKKRLGGHFNKCLCANVAHMIGTKLYDCKYILWHDVDCVVTNNFICEINKKIILNKSELLAIHTFPFNYVLHANNELSHKIRNNEVNVENIKLNTIGIDPPICGAPGGSMLIDVELFEKIGWFNTSAFYDHSPEDNFILNMLKKYGNYHAVEFNDNFMIHLWHG